MALSAGDRMTERWVEAPDKVLLFLQIASVLVDYCECTRVECSTETNTVRQQYPIMLAFSLMDRRHLKDVEGLTAENELKFECKYGGRTRVDPMIRIPDDLIHDLIPPPPE